MNELAVFTKPWKALSLPELAHHIKSLGFEWIELPVRPGFQVEPEKIERDLPAAVKNIGRARRQRPECDGRLAAWMMNGSIAPAPKPASA